MKRITKKYPIGSMTLLTGLIVLLLLLNACNGGNDNGQTPSGPDTSISGKITFAAGLPLTDPPVDAFDEPVINPGSSFLMRIVDPGDDIGQGPVPTPGTMSLQGDYSFDSLEANLLAYLNVKFTVDDNMELNGSARTPVSFHVPVSIVEGVAALMSATIDRPDPSVLQMNYTWRGGDGSREVSFRLDFVTDLLEFDLDHDGLFDDLVAVDRNHDAVPDYHSSMLETFDNLPLNQGSGVVSGVGTNSISINGQTFEVWGHTNIENNYNYDPIALSEVAVGSTAHVIYVVYAGENIAASIGIDPDPGAQQLEFDVVREGVIETITPTSIIVDGVLFREYQAAVLEDTLGNPIQVDDLEVGLRVTVTGERQDLYIKATKIVLEEVTPQVQYIERQGIITAVDPGGNPPTITIVDQVYEINGLTVIKDLAGVILDPTYLTVGSPVWIMAHESGGSFVADIIELQYSIEQETRNPEIIVIVNDESAITAVNDAVATLAPETPVTPFVVSTYPATQNDPPCINTVFEDLLWSSYILMGHPGYISAYPYAESDECSLLVLVEDGYPGAQAWINAVFPDGIGGGSLVFDIVTVDLSYGCGQEMAAAFDTALDLADTLAANENYVTLYVSPEIGFDDN